MSFVFSLRDIPGGRLDLSFDRFPGVALRAELPELGVECGSLVGERVTVAGLRSRPELNGRSGRVTKVERTSGRVVMAY